MRTRFVAKKQGEGRTAVWGVYDVQNGSWPYQTPELGVVVQDVKTEPEAQAEADRLTAAHGGVSDKPGAKKKARPAEDDED